MRRDECDGLCRLTVSPVSGYLFAVSFASVGVPFIFSHHCTIGRVGGGINVCGDKVGLPT